MMPSASGRAVSVPRTAFVLRSKITTEPSPSVMNPRPASGAVAQNLYRVLGLDDSGLAQHLGRDGISVKFFAHLHQPLQTHDVKFLAENVSEAALRHARS